MGPLDGDITEQYLSMARAHVRRAVEQPNAEHKAFYLGQARAVLNGGLYDPEADHDRLRGFDLAAEMERATAGWGRH